MRDTEMEEHFKISISESAGISLRLSSIASFLFDEKFRFQHL